MKVPSALGSLPRRARDSAVMTTRSDIAVQKRKDTTTIRLGGDVTVRIAAVLQQRLSQLARTPADTVIDLSHATAVDVSAVQLLMAFKRTTKAEGRTFSFLPPTDPALARLMANTGIQYLLNHL
jgi:anti-anti-sigma regulatory factor